MPEFVEGLPVSGKFVRRGAGGAAIPGNLTPGEIEAEAHDKALRAAGGNIPAAARALGLGPAGIPAAQDEPAGAGALTGGDVCEGSWLGR